jgi:hypothetical protein
MLQADPPGPDFTYVQVANAIAARINIGEIRHRLPDCRHMAREFGVAYQTVRHSLRLLRDRGLIVTRPGRGTFVVCPALPVGVPAEMPEPLTCNLGGLTALTHVELTAASMHIARCHACQLEFVKCGGLLPRPKQMSCDAAVSTGSLPPSGGNSLLPAPERGCRQYDDGPPPRR